MPPRTFTASPDDITDDAESAEVDAEAVTLLRKRHRRMTLLVVVVIVASLVSGFCWRRSLQTGSPVNCSHQTGVADEKDYCYGGFKPLQPSGPQLGRSQAGPYFAKAVKGHGRGIRRRAPRRRSAATRMR